MIGCYAQTELGHGSNVRGMRTTATYPLATHATVFAQLFTQGKWYGGHWFMVQLRGEDLKLLPGVELGDIGTLAGNNECPVGYLRLTNLRVPRRYLLDRLQHVTPAGEYVKGPPPGAMDIAPGTARGDAGGGGSAAAK